MRFLLRAKRLGHAHITNFSKIRHRRAVVQATHEHQHWPVWFGKTCVLGAYSVFMGGLYVNGAGL